MKIKGTTPKLPPVTVGGKFRLPKQGSGKGAAQRMESVTKRMGKLKKGKV